MYLNISIYLYTCIYKYIYDSLGARSQYYVYISLYIHIVV